MKPISIPVVALGPGSRAEAETPDYMAMPGAMHTFSPPVLPEAIGPAAAARHALQRVLAALQRAADGGPAGAVDLAGLPERDLALVGQVLGEGEVSAQVDGPEGRLRIQEGVFAGVWRVRGEGPDGRPLDRVEVGPIPAAVRRPYGRPAPERPQPGPGLASAPALLTEIGDRAARPEDHVINLSLLPFTPEDGDYLDRALGRGPVTILSRGYGNRRITATALARVWWVQYFNSQDALILNTIEIAAVPEVALAAAEDIADSRERLAEVLEWLG